MLYEFEIYRKLAELKSSLSLIEEVEGEVNAAKSRNLDVSQAEAKITEARKLFEEDGNYAAARLAATEARALPAATGLPAGVWWAVGLAVLISVVAVLIALRRRRA